MKNLIPINDSQLNTNNSKLEIPKINSNMLSSVISARSLQSLETSKRSYDYDDEAYGGPSSKKLKKLTYSHRALLQENSNLRYNVESLIDYYSPDPTKTLKTYIGSYRMESVNTVCRSALGITHEEYTECTDMFSRSKNSQNDIVNCRSDIETLKQRNCVLREGIRVTNELQQSCSTIEYGVRPDHQYTLRNSMQNYNNAVAFCNKQENRGKASNQQCRESLTNQIKTECIRKGNLASKLQFASPSGSYSNGYQR